MYCPNCGQLNPPAASRCVCGRELASSAITPPPLPSIEPSADRLASLSERFFGQILDSLVGIAVFLAGLAIYFVSKPAGIGGMLLAMFYMLFADGFREGQSYGKKALNIAVVDERTGAPCTFGKSFVRNFLLMILGVIDWVFIFGEKRQRLGDKAANTIVVKTAPRH